MPDMRLIENRTPEQCGHCGGSTLECVQTNRYDGSLGPGIGWIAKCRWCSTEWIAVALIRPELWKGQQVEWNRYERPESDKPKR